MFNTPFMGQDGTVHPNSFVNYNVNVQRQLTRDLLLQLAYVGSQGHRLMASQDLNYGQAQPCLDLNQLPALTGDQSLAGGPIRIRSRW
jgi:hypothetical protein